MSASFPLRYVCKWCGVTIAVYGNVLTTTPATLSVCDKPECRAAASAAYKATA